MTRRFVQAGILTSIFCWGGIISASPSFIPQHSEVTSLRNVDFLNFTYNTPPATRCTATSGNLCLQNTIIVKDGQGIENDNDHEFYVAHPASESKQVVYGDLTGDGVEEAVISFRYDMVDGSAYYFAVFVLENGKPRLLQWLSHWDVNNNKNDFLLPNDMEIKDGRILITGVALNPEDESAPPLYSYDHVWTWDAAKKRFQPLFTIKP